MSSTTSSGLRTWLLQRLSAVYIAVFSIVFYWLWVNEPATFENWRNWVAHPLANMSLILFVLAILVHGWVGIRDIIMDYINPVHIRYLLLICFALLFGGMGLWVLRTLVTVTPI